MAEADKQPHPNPFWSLLIVLPLIVVFALVWGLLNGLVGLRVFGMALVALIGALGVVLVIGKSASLTMALDSLSASKDRWPEARKRLLMVAPNILPRLLALLPNRDAGVAYRVLELLGEIGDRSATPRVVAMLRDREATTRKAAVWALGKLRDRRALGALMGCLEHEEAAEHGPIIDALAATIGHSHGEHPAAWRAWWAATGERYPYQISGAEPADFPFPRAVHA